MTRRLRTTSALLALLALTVYFAESVAAPWCMPVATVASAASGGGADAPARSGALHHGPSEASPGSRHSDSQTSPCPLGMADSGASCVAAPLATPPETLRSAPAIEVALLSLSDRIPDLPLVTAHFHPPRA
jgi:hypothetical protein